MMRSCAAIGTLLLAVIGALPASTELPDQWRSWHYSRAVLQDSLPQSGTPGQIVLPWEMFAHCRIGCADARLIDDKGQEVPYELRTRRGTALSESRGTRLAENSFVPGKYTQIIGELMDDVLSSAVRVETDEPDFIVWAEVALSDDAKTWRVVEPRAPIARFQKRSINGTQMIPFVGINFRFIRVRIFQAERQFRVTGLTLFHQTESRPDELSQVPARFDSLSSVQEADGTSLSVWRADLATSQAPVSQLRFTTDTPEFYRPVRIRATADGKEWVDEGSGFIYRYKQAEKIRECLSVSFAEWPENKDMQIEVINGNDKPLVNVGMSLFGVPRRLVFKTRAGASYRLLYGNEHAAPPQYDLSRYLDATSATPAYLSFGLAPEEIIANYRDPRPFSERHPEVLWISLGVAILVIGLTALKTLRASASTPNSNAH